MRRYGGKKASNTAEQIHGAKFCGTCAAYNEAPQKSGRAYENRQALREISAQLKDVSRE